MGEYRYRAIDADGKVRTGIIEARSEFDVEYRLGNQGYDLISLKRRQRRSFGVQQRMIPRRELINMVFHLEQLTQSGVALLDGLSDLRDSTASEPFKDVLAGVVESIEGGSNFSSALAQFPRVFDDVFVALIAVGEESGELPRVLREMGASMRRTDELLANTRKLLMYPAIVGVIIVGVAAFLMLYLVPRLIPFVSELGGELPMHTIALIATANFIAEYWLVILLTPFVLSAAIDFAARARPEIRYVVDRLKLRVPLVGPVAFKMRLSRFASYAALLYGAGITVTRALEICERLVGNRYIGDAIAEARHFISEGGGISESFARIAIFPPLVIRMLRVGESTGNLDSALLNVSYFYDREVRETLDTLEPAISPVLTVTMGAILGWIILSVLGPVWSAATSIS